MGLYYRRNGHSNKLVLAGNGALIEEMNDAAKHVIEIQADGLELRLIEEQFAGIPKCSNHIVTWYGDDAKFIAKHFR